MRNPTGWRHPPQVKWWVLTPQQLRAMRALKAAEKRMDMCDASSFGARTVAALRRKGLVRYGGAVYYDKLFLSRRGEAVLRRNGGGK